MIKITTFVAIFFLVVSLTASFFVAAQVPSRVPCQCVRGVTRDTSVTDHCKCSGSCSVADYVLPFCTFKNTDRVNMAIRYKNVTGIALDAAEAQIQGHLGVDGDDVKWIRRLKRFETGDGTDVVVQYLITGSYVNGIYTDVYAATQPAYIATPEALDMWQMGTIVSEPGVFSKYFSSGNVLFETTITYSGEKIVIRIIDVQVAFVIGGLSVLLFCALIEGFINCIFKPKETPEQVSEREALMNNNNNNNQPTNVEPQPFQSPYSPEGTVYPQQQQEMQPIPQAQLYVSSSSSNNNNVEHQEPTTTDEKQHAPMPTTE